MASFMQPLPANTLSIYPKMITKSRRPHPFYASYIRSVENFNLKFFYADNESIEC